MRFNTPILLLTYKKIKTLRKVIQSIKKIKPRVLYINSDGPKNNEPQEVIAVNKIRTLLDNFNFNCRVVKKYNQENLGLRDSVISAVTWFFKNEKFGIILEDDCLPSKSFYHYCQENLIYYQNNKRIMNIGGVNFLSGIKNLNYEEKNTSYFFTKSPMIWGWATWRDRWRYFDKNMTRWKNIYKSERKLKKLFNDKYSTQLYPERINAVYNKKDSSWAYTWDYTLRIMNGLNITPKVNLVSNIGFDEHPTHKTPEYKIFNNLRRFNIKKIIHPNKIFHNKNADENLSRIFLVKNLKTIIFLIIRFFFINKLYNLKKITLKIFT